MSGGRRHLRRWHRWFGLLAGLWLLLLALTGSAIAYYDALDGWLNPDWRHVAQAEAPAVPDVDAAMRLLQQALPGFDVRMIDLPDNPGESLMILGSLPAGEDGRTTVQAFAHPGTGQLLGWRDVEQFGLGRRQIMDSLYGLHIDLLMGQFGIWLVGMTGLLWALDHVPAIALAVPRLSRFLASFRIAGRPGSLRHAYDLHRAPGMWQLPVTFMLAVTGLMLSWPEASRDAVRLVSPVSDRLHYAMPERAEPPRSIGLNEAMQRFSTHNPQRIDSLHPLPHNAVIGVRSHDPRDIDDMGRLWTYIDMEGGQIVASRHDRGESGGDLLFAWAYPLHSGRAFGAFGQAIILVAGLATAALVATGILLWARR